jgi:hypothetical protein
VRYKRASKRHAFWACGVVALWVGACQSPPDRLVYENFRQIRPQLSTEADVVSLLGEPSHRLGELWMYERPEKHLFAKIEFDADGRVVDKDWIDGAEGVWEDVDDPGVDPRD